MPLKIHKLDQSSVAILNKWADSVDNNHNTLMKRIQQLEGALARATGGGNPALKGNGS